MSWDLEIFHNSLPLKYIVNWKPEEEYFFQKGIIFNSYLEYDFIEMWNVSTYVKSVKTIQVYFPKSDKMCLIINH